MENIEFDEKTLTVGENTLIYNTMKDGEKGNIKTVIPNLKDEYVSDLQIIKGKLSIKTQDKKIMKIAQNVRIDVNPYDITEDGELLSSTGNLLLMGDDGTLVLPDSVKKIGYGAFSGVSGLKKIVIPESVTEIGAYAFANNTTLESVEIRGNLNSIGDYAFDCDGNLKKINLPDSINYIGMMAFRKTGITEVVIPKNIEKIKAETFAHCQLIYVKMQEGIKTIEKNSFYGGLFESIELPSILESISSDAFNNCKNLTNIDISKNENFIYTSGMLMNKNDMSIAFISSIQLSNITEFEIPEGIKNFDNNISTFKNIKKLILPSSLEGLLAECIPSSINDVEIKKENNNLILENNILYNTDNELIMCFSKEQDINIMEGIKTINVGAFCQASNVQNITFPDSLNKINGMIVTQNANIKNINIGKNVIDIDTLFMGINFNGTVNISSENPKYEVSNNVLYEKSDNKKVILKRVLYLVDEKMEIEPDTTVIGDNAFYGQWKMKRIIIPEGVNIIGSSFKNCSNLEKVEIPSTVTTIDESCFSDGTNSLSQIIIKKSENSIQGAPWGAVKGLKVVNWEK